MYECERECVHACVRMCACACVCVHAHVALLEHSVKPELGPCSCGKRDKALCVPPSPLSSGSAIAWPPYSSVVSAPRHKHRQGPARSPCLLPPQQRDGPRPGWWPEGSKRPRPSPANYRPAACAKAEPAALANTNGHTHRTAVLRLAQRERPRRPRTCWSTFRAG